MKPKCSVVRVFLPAGFRIKLWGCQIPNTFSTKSVAEHDFFFASLVECSAYAKLRRSMLNKTMEALTKARVRRGVEYNGLGPDDFEYIDFC